MIDVYTDAWTDTWTNMWGAEPVALRRMWDAAYPPTSPPKWEVVAGYIGGNTPHVWTAAEWSRQTARYRLPIFVRSTGGDAAADAAFCVSWLRGHSVPKGVTLALDFETRVDAGYLEAFDSAVGGAGWKVMVYGTRRTVLQNPKPSGGYWDAQWTNEPHLNAGSAATQYGGDTTLGQPWDASLVADPTRLWDMEGDLTVLDDATKTYLDSKFAAVQQGLLVVIRGDATTDPPQPDTHPNNIERTRQDLAAGLSAVTSRLNDIVATLAAGLPVTLEQAQLDEIKASLQQLEGSALVQLAVSPAP
jgi:hypothetical protein